MLLLKSVHKARTFPWQVICAQRSRLSNIRIKVHVQVSYYVNKFSGRLARAGSHFFYFLDVSFKQNLYMFLVSCHDVSLHQSDEIKIVTMWNRMAHTQTFLRRKDSEFCKIRTFKLSNIIHVMILHNSLKVLILHFTVCISWYSKTWSHRFMFPWYPKSLLYWIVYFAFVTFPE